MRFLKRHFEWILFIIGFAAVHLILISPEFGRGRISRERASQFGDFTGGYFGTIFSLASLLLLIRTLRDQKLSSERESFENRFLEMIRIHRENVTEIRIGEESGRRIFVSLIREFRLILREVQKTSKQSPQRLNQRAVFEISYLVLFFGIGPNSSRMLRNALSSFDDNFVTSLEYHLSSDDLKTNAQPEGEFSYLPFDGHQSRLGHYYRHLFQSVKYVNEQVILNDHEKYQFLKTLRAQLSTHEQALLFINSLSMLGREWYGDDKLIINCRMVRNIPKAFFDPQSEFDLSEVFPKNYFEWESAAGG